MKLRMGQAIARALADEMERDPDVVFFGEDVARAGGPFKTSTGLLEQFGPNRVRDTPISEMGFLGVALGAAATGLRPIAEVMIVEFLGVALDQVVTEAAKYHYLSGGTIRVPLTIRASIGGGHGLGCQHSQTLETWMYGSPGLKLVVASGARSAYGLLRSAIQDDNPVVMLEPRRLYGAREDFEPGEDALITLGKAEVVKSGNDVTIIGLGPTVDTVRSAVSAASWSAEIIDLQTLIPWDRECVGASVAKTGRLVIVEENPFSGGWGTEIASYIGSEHFGDMQAPIVRITCPDVPVPAGRALEARYLPDAPYVRSQIEALMTTGRRPKAWWEEAMLT